MKNSLNLILDEIPIPRFARVHQDLPAPTLDDVPGRITGQLAAPEYHGLVASGQRIGITAGSRGIANMPLIVRTLADWVKQQGATPVVIPAMGSHGGATAEGQRDMLLGMGFTPDVTGCEIVSSLDVTKLGEVDGLDVLYSTDALNCDGVILTNRVKAHTDIVGPIESGLMKMATIGTGKHRGALQAHSRGLGRAGESIEKIAPVIFEKGNIIFGVAVLENALDQTRDVVLVPTDRIVDVEPDLLAESRQHLPRLLIHDIDVLVVDWMGKNISGDGMDPNVLGRSLIGVKNPDMHVNQIVVLDMTPESHGNSTGIGLADITTKRLFDDIDWVAMFTNGVTSNGIAGSRVPPHMPNQKMAIQCAERLTLNPDPLSLRIVRIVNTLDVQEILVSEPLLDEVRDNPALTQVDEPAELVFDDNDDLFPAAAPH
ncbi:lactate racemase domain-containing protein [Brooklawnia cerclae]|uniref:LarA-like N-terminal domain-containing protein n=1 Tax=Brooklawnia cerclae TaxID=349934 RepID=A0ABX0SD83_9ACTN|nr:hypothetical protein [Brooklawnia cerclae]NIH56352.1 hypothetical protein [Brooklawnia cerclae]